MIWLLMSAIPYPGQFLAKLYTEAHGRAPSVSDWYYFRNDFYNNCNHASLAGFIRFVYTSQEFLSKNYTNAERIFTLYRGVLNRDPDSSGFYWYLNNLQNGNMTWQDVVNSVANSTEFQNMVPIICDSPSYHWRAYYPFKLPSSSGGYDVPDGDSLQKIINNANVGDTIWLKQGSLIIMKRPLIINKRVYIATYGKPDVTHYAKMARLLRHPDFQEFQGDTPSPIIAILADGAGILNIWIDGFATTIWYLKGYTTDYKRVRNLSILVLANNVVIKNCKFSSNFGWSHIHAPSWFGIKKRLYIAGNIVTAYDHFHTIIPPNYITWTDGFDIEADSTIIENNSFIDLTDGSITIFRLHPGVPQTTIIRNNIILNSGNSAYSAIGFDNQRQRNWIPNDKDTIINGGRIENNIIMTAEYNHIDVVIFAGPPHAWVGTYDFNIRQGYAKGIAIVNNSSGYFNNSYLPIRCNTTILVSILDAYVQGNNINCQHYRFSKCPREDIVFEKHSGYASGNVQGPYNDMLVFRNCVDHQDISNPPYQAYVRAFIFDSLAHQFYPTNPPITINVDGNPYLSNHTNPIYLTEDKHTFEAPSYILINTDIFLQTIWNIFISKKVINTTQSIEESNIKSHHLKIIKFLTY